MKKTKLLFGIVLVIVGILSVLFIPGGLINIFTEEQLSLETQQILSQERFIEQIQQTPKGYSETIPENKISFIDVFVVSIGYFKDVLAVLASFYGILISRKTLKEKKGKT